MGVLLWVEHPDVVQLDVQILIHRVKCACDAQIVFQLQCDLEPSEVVAQSELRTWNHRNADQVDDAALAAYLFPDHRLEITIK